MLVSAVTAVVSGQQGDNKQAVWSAVVKHLQDSEGIVAKQGTFQTRWHTLTAADPKLAALIPHTEIKWDTKMVQVQTQQCLYDMIIRQY